MKQFSKYLFAFLLVTNFGFAQKIGYVDTDFILSQIPEYKAAQSELDKTSADWQKEVEMKIAEVDKLKQGLNAEAMLLTEEMRKKRQGEIDIKDREAKELQKQRFGVDGDLFKKRMELVKPLQDKVYNAIKAVAEKSGLAIIFDKASDLTMLYCNNKYDKSEDVLMQLGYKKK